MDILYCGDKNVVDGVIISALSIAKHTKEVLNIYVFTMSYKNAKKSYLPIEQKDLERLEKELKKINKNSKILVIDVSKHYLDNPTTANKKTYFTPYCMLRLYADKMKDMPEKLLYLDTDVVCVGKPELLFEIDIDNYEMAGVLDRYGSNIIRFPFGKKKYINSGVLLLNLKKIRETRLFERAIDVCKKWPMIMPDQSALNFCSKYKRIIETRFNNQKEITENTVFRHFSNTFKFWPFFKVQAIKPWHIEALHNVLNTYEFDDVLEKYQELKEVK